MHASPRSASLGRIVFATAILAFGVENLVVGDLLPELQRAPAWLPARAAWGYLNGAVLVGAAACIIADRRVRDAARVIAAVLALWLIAFHAPALIAAPRNGGTWTVVFEVVALAGAAALLAAPSRPALGRVMIGVSLLVFGFLHFRYRDYVAAVIPAWIPAHMFWAYATGVAHLAGGAGLLLRIQERLAAVLLAVMFGTWVVILHVPRAVAKPDRPEWTSLFVALAMCGASLLLVAAQRRPHDARPALQAPTAGNRSPRA